MSIFAKFFIAFDSNHVSLIFTATASIEALKLDDTTAQVIFEYITTEAISSDNRLAASTILKNIIKKVYGVSSHSLQVFAKSEMSLVIPFH